MSSSHQQLLSACAQGNIAKVRELIAAIQISTSKSVPFAAMAHQAAETGHVDILQICIDEGGLDVNEDWETAGDMLINAVWELKHGADPNSGHLMADSTSAITAAAAQGRTDLSELLLQHNAQLSGSGALAAAAEKQQLSMLRWLLDHGADIDEIGVHDYGDRRKKKFEGTALHQAAANGNVEMAKLLVKRGASLNIKDPMHRTPLERAIEESQEEVAKYLGSVQGP
ncbi:MAG: hypothetical protein Q9186_003366 [Xanthomendoza sp. 1 TL-2023]